MRKKIIAGNWKMNLNAHEADQLVRVLTSKANPNSGSIVLLAPPFVYLQTICQGLKEHQHILIAAQNCSDHLSGAFTGEISASMLASIGVTYCIIGHSERRSYFNESNQIIAQKVFRLLENNLCPVFCCGESSSQREGGGHFDVVGSQLHEGLFQLKESEIQKCVIAYEPVWAIGTGVTATPEQAQEMHQFIRRQVEEKYDKSIADEMSILYGGSVSASNAFELFTCADVDGALVGGASLKADEFIKIIEAMSLQLSR